VTFSSNFYGLTSMYNGGAGNFSATPTGTPAIFVNGTLGAASVGTMNVAPGFSSGLNFFYSAGFAANQSATITIWSGSNGTGTVLATITLTNNNGNCTAPAYCNWSAVGVNFTGTAHSVTFSGPANEMGLADITLSSNSTAVPEPGSIFLLATGLTGVSFSRVRRFFSL
jgi:PEP-CTERM motif